MDQRKDYGEVRMQIIGRARFGILFVVYTERERVGGEEVIRIISARLAGRAERLKYQRGNFAARI